MTEATANPIRRLVLVAACALIAILGLAPPAPAAVEPEFVYEPVPTTGLPIPPPVGLFEGPCGVGVDSAGRFFVADYYHDAVDKFEAAVGAPEPIYVGQLPTPDPLNGPCGLAVDPIGRLFVNSYHQKVSRYQPLAFPPGPPPAFGPPATIDAATPTGVAAGSGPVAVAVNPADDHVFVNYGNRVAEYDSAADGNETVRDSIGAGIIDDSFGLDVYGADGNVYVNDDNGRTIRILDPAGTSVLETIDSADLPDPGSESIGSLFEKPLAVDQSTGNVYVPYVNQGNQDVVAEFEASGAFVSRLTGVFERGYPSGLATDDSGTASDGNVYVTSGSGPESTVRAFGPAQPDGSHPAVPGPSGAATPQGEFDKACGTAVDGEGNVYVASYGSGTVSVFEPDGSYLTQFAPAGLGEDGCGLAVDSVGVVYLNSWHHGVYRFTPSAYPPSAATTYGAGVPVGPPSGRVYVDNRTYVSVYEPSGAPAEVGGEPLRIGVGSLLDGYAVAVSAHPATAGYVYVPDAGDQTVKVYDPEGDLDDPVATIDGQENPTEGFVSLRDSAVAVDRVSGNVYVADNLQLGIAEQPETAIYVFAPDGAYLGRLKYNVVDSEPPGLAVDNSAEPTQGRVFVTSGNTIFGSVYAYPPGAQTDEAVPAHFDPDLVFKGKKSALFGAGTAGGGCEAACAPAAEPAAEASEIARRGALRLNIDGKLSPRSLPRKGRAPIAVTVGWKIATTDGSPVPRLKKVRIEINRHGHFDYTGLPVCPYDRIDPASSSRALSACRSALVGQGHFTAEISLAGQEPYPAGGRLLVFNGRRGGKPVLFGQIYSPSPFATSFVIVFEVEDLGRGTYGTALTASLPPALSSWGNLTEVEMKLSRRYRHAGRPHSYISAGCPAPSGFPGAVFPLARTSFDFAGGEVLSSTLSRSCTARR
jgi:streptogramin lyase